MKYLYYLLIFVPISIGLEFLHGAPTWIFVTACLAVIPLAGLIGNATDDLGKHLGPTWGGLLNATFGNATELIIAVMAIREGLLAVVKASITGSIIGNLLLVVGASALVGGVRYKTQSFNEHAASLNASLLTMSVLALMVPAVFVHTVPGLYAKAISPVPAPRVEGLSLGVAGLLIVVYLLSLFFSLRTHEGLLGGSTPDEREPAKMSKAWGIGILFVATVLIAIESEFLVGSIKPVTESLHLTQMFVGVVVVAIIGNAAEHASAVLFAWRNQMDVSLNIAIGSSTQIALFVAPLLIFISLAMGHPMTLIFNQFELVSIAFAAAITAVISLDGKSHWMEGVLLLASYAVISLAFYFIPQ